MISRGSVVACAVLLAGAACGGGGAVVDETGDGSTPAAAGTSPPPTTTPSTTPSATDPEAPAEFELCRITGSVIGPNSFEDDTLGIVHRYGDEHPDEWGGWSFRSDIADGGLAIYVTDRIEFHREELTALLPPTTAFEVKLIDLPLRVVSAAADEINAGLGLEHPSFMEGAFPGVSEGRNRVWVVTERASQETTRRLTEAVGAGDASLVCLSPIVGPERAGGKQLQSGPGWRLIEEGLSGPWELTAATTEAGYRALWTLTGFETDRPAVDFDDEVVLYVGAITGSCTSLFLTELNIERSPAVVEVVLEQPHCRGPELAIAVPHSYLLAVDRSAVPDRFEMRTSNADLTAAIDLAESAEAVRLGNPRLDITLRPEGDDHTLIVTATTTGGSESQLLFHDVFEVIPEEVLGPGVEPRPFEPRLWSNIVEPEVTGVEVDVQRCVEGECGDPERCSVSLEFALFDHQAVDLDLFDDGGCAFGVPLPVA